MDSRFTQAPELRVQRWIGADGEPLDSPLQLSDLGTGHKLIFCFQDWCPGCHSHGFPALRALHEGLSKEGYGFAAIQTVFEGAEFNTYEQLRKNQQRYALPIPFGHDVPMPGQPFTTFMQDYRTQGTPWFTIITPDGAIAHRGFSPPRQLLEAVHTCSKRH